VYQHKLNVLRVATRGSLQTLIYAALLDGHSDAYETGSAVSLMSTDAESLSQAPEILHELWSYTLEAIFGTIMLAGQVGWLWLVPFLLILCSVKLVHEGRWTVRLIWNSLLTNQSARCKEPTDQAEGLECSHTATYRGCLFHACFYEVSQGAGTLFDDDVSDPTVETRRDPQGCSNSVDERNLYCEWCVIRCYGGAFFPTRLSN
jgi:hypothetical protein